MSRRLSFELKIVGWKSLDYSSIACRVTPLTVNAQCGSEGFQTEHFDSISLAHGEMTF